MLSRSVVSIGCWVCVMVAAVAADAAVDVPLRDEAVNYRLQGYQLQAKGSLGEAVSYYQKSIVLDPSYPTPHNDLGVIFEQQGQLDEAEREYRRALELDPNYLSAHSNLALLYEKRGQFDQAVRHWEQRAALGSPSDPWTKRAQERLVMLRPQVRQTASAAWPTSSGSSSTAFPAIVTVPSPSVTSAPVVRSLPVATPISMGGSGASATPQPVNPVPVPSGISIGSGQYPPTAGYAGSASATGPLPVAQPYQSSTPPAAPPVSYPAPRRHSYEEMEEEQAAPGGWKRWVPFRRYIPFMGEKPSSDVVQDSGRARSEDRAERWDAPSPPPQRTSHPADEAYQQGVEYYRSERYAEAWDAFRRAQDLDPGNPRIAGYLERTEEVLKQQQQDQLLRRMTDAKQQDMAERTRVARMIEDYYIRGRLYYEQGAYKKAKAEYEKILATLLESQLIQ